MRALELQFAADQRVDFTFRGPLHQIDGKGLQRVGFFLLLPGLLLQRARRAVIEGRLGQAVGDVLEHIQARDPLGLQEKAAWESFS
jgi:hypothetical protein